MRRSVLSPRGPSGGWAGGCLPSRPSDWGPTVGPAAAGPRGRAARAGGRASKASERQSLQARGRSNAN
eukprot:6336400-Heterocapsa_arctica.AAC.1